jgi:hypothetical protein
MNLAETWLTNFSSSGQSKAFLADQTPPEFCQDFLPEFGQTDFQAGVGSFHER